MSTKIFFIAGEASGDALGASLIQSLKKIDSDIEIMGVGGVFMKAQGLETLVPMDELCVIGLWEVISQVTRLIRLLDGIVRRIEKLKPDILVTIDLPDFNFRIAEKLKKRGVFKGKIVHYVAPTVWAWRPERAKKISGFLDGVMCLYPFEPEYFTKHGLKAAFVGHPVTDIERDDLQPDAFCKEYDIPEDMTKIGIFFGSRPSEIKAIAPVLIDAVEALKEQHDNFCLILPTLAHMELDITNIATDLPCPAYVHTKQPQKWDAFAACDVAVAVSGTVGLELSYLGVPHIIAYKVHPVTWVLLRFLVTIKYAHLGNILLDKPIVPEFLQSKCTPLNIAKALLEYINKPALVAEQKAAMRDLAVQLRPKDGGLSSDSAAHFVLEFKKEAS